MTSTATVETLTAQVHTLVIGTRQITLSVAKQLDVINLPDLAVMGRVKIAGKHDYHVIGTDIRTGVLAVAEYEPYAHRDDHPGWAALNQAARRSPLIVLAGLR